MSTIEIMEFICEFHERHPVILTGFYLTDDQLLEIHDQQPHGPASGSHGEFQGFPIYSISELTDSSTEQLTWLGVTFTSRNLD